jgi:excisionase family DNA binding protein
MSDIKEKEKSIMRAEEVWLMLRIGRNTLYQWCEQGLIPHRKVGRVILFSRKRLLEWIEKKNPDERGT